MENHDVDTKTVIYIWENTPKLSVCFAENIYTNKFGIPEGTHKLLICVGEVYTNILKAYNLHCAQDLKLWRTIAAGNVKYYGEKIPKNCGIYWVFTVYFGSKGNVVEHYTKLCCFRFAFC